MQPVKANIPFFATLLALAIPTVAAAQPADLSFRSRLTSAAFQPPAPMFKGDGDVVAVIDRRTVKVTGDFRGLASPATHARLLSGSAPGVPGSVVVGEIKLSAHASAGAFSGTLQLNPSQLALLTSRRVYVQIETQAAPDGALWGWLMPNHHFPGERVPEPRNWYATN
jgi:hypothetical protein